MWAELLASDRHDAAVEPGLLEDGGGELGPRALALRRQVPDAARKLEEPAGRLGEMADVRGAPALVVDHAHLVALGAEAEHRADEVRARPAEEPGAPHDPALAHLAFPEELRAPVGGERACLVRFDVRLALRPVEDVVGGEVDHRRPERRHGARPIHVDPPRALLVLLRAVHVRPRGGVEHEPRPVAELERAGGDVELRP